jgi:hypothetical protein
MFQVQEVTGLDLMFGGNCAKLMPKYEEIPAQAPALVPAGIRQVVGRASRVHVRRMLLPALQLKS